MTSPTKVGETLWTAKVSTVSQFADLDMAAPPTGHDEARQRAQALRERLEQEAKAPRARVSADTLRKRVR